MSLTVAIVYPLLALTAAVLLYITFRTDDRRWIYLAVGLCVLVPVLVVLELPIAVSPEVQKLYDTVEALPDSSVVMLPFDYYPSTLAETEPMSRAALHQLFRKNCRIITMTTVPLGGPSLAERITRDVAAKWNKVYGIDYVNLGYKANYVAVLKGMGSSIEAIFPADNSGTPLAQIPMMKGIRNYADVSFILDISDNSLPDYWISIVRAQYGVPMAAGVTAVSAAQYYAYVESGQMDGLLGGMKGAAEYEELVGHAGMATKGMTAQSLVHLFIIFSVAVGNAIYWRARSRKGRTEA